MKTNIWVLVGIVVVIVVVGFLALPSFGGSKDKNPTKLESSEASNIVQPSNAPILQPLATQDVKSISHSSKQNVVLATPEPVPVVASAPPMPSVPSSIMGKRQLVANMPNPLPQVNKDKVRVKMEAEREMVDEAVKFDPGTVPEVEFNTEAYEPIVENSFIDVAKEALSTFSIDIDSASYSNMRRFLVNNQLPPKDAVRIEEMVNYFQYSYDVPKNDVPFAVHVDIADCPWNPDHRLARIGLKGKEISKDQRPPCNLVFLLDVSGSMSDHNKLPLLKDSLKMLVQNLTEKDRVSIVVYAGASGVALPPTSGDRKATIIQSLEGLEAGGSTNAGQGIELAYRLAIENFREGGVNRVILATDGDFNVGVTNRGALLRLIEEKAKSKVFLTVLGFGMGNYKDSTLEMLADKGNGNYGYIDTIAEARKMLVEQVGGTLVTIAKDVKIQVEFNPNHVQQYRLIGYENRLMAAEDFNNDAKDAGEIGAGHTVTAFYEIVPISSKPAETTKVDPLKYQTQPQLSDAGKSNELMTVKLRYKMPEENTSKLLEYPIRDEEKLMKQSSHDLMFASSVVCFGMLLVDSKYKGGLSYDLVLELATEGLGTNPDEYRREFIQLVQKAKALQK